MKKDIGKTIPQDETGGKSFPEDEPGKGTTTSNQSQAGGTTFNGNLGGKGADVRNEAGSLDKGMPKSPQTPPGGTGMGTGGERVKGLSQVKSFVNSALKTTVGKLAMAGIGIIAAAAVTVGIISAAKTPDLSGTWAFQMDGTSTCGMPYDDWETPVFQDGNTLHGYDRPEPVLNGVIHGKTVTFSIIIDPEDDNGCGDFSELSGTISGNTISGTIVGHDCAYFCVWDGNFTVTIRENE